MNININTKDYWDNRFVSGDWEQKCGRTQTKQFAEEQLKYLKVTPNFSGTILDFGCGLGDAMPLYRNAYPNAILIGIDISEIAIKKCSEKYGNIAKFIQGNHIDVPNVDIIIASNVFEHLSDDINVARHLRAKCRDLYIITPYKEILVAGSEHINSYDKNYFRDLGSYEYRIYFSKGWGLNGRYFWWNQVPKNILRPLFGRKIARRGRQILFHFV